LLTKDWYSLKEVSQLTGIPRSKLYIRVAQNKTVEARIPGKKIKNKYHLNKIVVKNLLKNGLPKLYMLHRKPSKINFYQDRIGIIANNTQNEFFFDKDMWQILYGYAWVENGAGYLRGELNIDNKKARMMLAHNIVIGNPLLGFRVDHIDRDTKNNMRNNLRIVDYVCNAVNSKKRINNKSGYKGVIPHRLVKTTGKYKWRAKIKVSGKDYCLGLYDDPREAARAYDNAVVKFYGEFAATNESLGLLKNIEGIH
jgi:hypothetical protein